MMAQNRYSLDFEKPILELERKIEELKGLTSKEGLDFEEEINRLQQRLKKLEKETFANLTPWQTVQLARHPNRPKSLTLAKLIFDDFILLHGDRGGETGFYRTPERGINQREPFQKFWHGSS